MITADTGEVPMKTIVYEKYGPPNVLQIKETAKPVLADNDILIRVHATTVTKFDCWERSATAPPGFGLFMRFSTGLFKPKIPVLGTELAGEIEAVGNNVKKFKVGEQVFGFTGMSLNTYTEYRSMSEDGVVTAKPANMTYGEAAAVPQGALTALFFLRNGNIRSGQKVLIFGASGGVGNYAVQLAKHFGAEVTGVCSTAKVEMVKSLGADKVIDYKKEDFTRTGDSYDIIFDTVGESSISRSLEVLRKGGWYLLATFGLGKLMQILWSSLTSGRKFFYGLLQERTEDLIFLKELVESGALRPIIDRSYPVEQITEAHRYAESGQKKGHIIITLK